MQSLLPTPALRLVLAVLAVAALAAPAHAQQDATTGPTLGIVLAPEDLADPVWTSPPAPAAERPLHARLVAPWAEVESEPGTYRWDRWRDATERLAGAGYDVVVCLTGEHPVHLPGGGLPAPGAGASQDAWIAFARSGVRALGASVQVWEIGERVERHDPDLYAFFLKSTALALRAEARAQGVALLVAHGTVASDRLDWQQQVLELDVDAYVDVLPLRLAQADPGAALSSLDAFFAAAVEHPPAPQIWAIVPPRDDDPWAGPALAVRALTGVTSEALLELPRGEPPPPPPPLVPFPTEAQPPVAAGPSLHARQVAWTAGMQRLLARGFAQAPLGVAALDTDPARSLRGEVLARFFRADTFDTMVVFRAGGAVLPQEQGTLRIDAEAVPTASVIDPITAQEWRTSGRAAGEARAIPVFVAAHPMVLVFARAVAPEEIEAEREALSVETRRRLTAEEVIARHQAVQKVQDDRLERWTTRSRVDFHYKLAQAGVTVDVSIVSNYFWQRGQGLEWEQTEYFLNGNRITWDTIPEIPLVQPEKVLTLPLDLTLDRTYVYRLLDDDRVEGRDAFVLAFEPADPDTEGSLYRGRIWIDQQSFVRLRTALIQTSLEPPVLTNEEIDTYRAFTGPDGFEYWLIGRVEGQQHWSVGGRNLVVRREQSFESYDINPAVQAFDSARARAHASTNLMIRDTPEGNRYLERQEGGLRTIKTTADTSKLFAAAGLYKDESVDNVLPLGGVNWFDYDFRDRDIQLNVFFAGVLGFVNASKPDLFGRRMDLAADAAFSAIKTDDKVFVGETEQLAERLRQRTQFAAVRLGIPFGEFVKLTLVGATTFQSFFQSEEAETERGPTFGFVLPRDHRVVTGRVEGEFNRRGWSLAATGAWSRRSRWEPWGLTDAATGAFVNPEFDPEHRSFRRWGATAFKEWYLRSFQKLRVQGDWLDGDNLDRFSAYSFTFFGDTRLNGFAGSGVRFDSGTLLRAGYSFNLFQVIRFDATVDTGDVSRDDPGTPSQRFTGVGLAGNVIGPWKTVISASYGRALKSDIPDLEGNQEFLVVVLKLFE